MKNLISFILYFTDYDSMKAYARAFENKNKPHSMLYISRILNVLSSNCMNQIYIQYCDFFTYKISIPSVGVKLSKDKFKQFEYNHRKGTTDININCNWKDIVRLNVLTFTSLKY